MLKTLPVKDLNLNVKSLGECQMKSPLSFKSVSQNQYPSFISDENRIRWNIQIEKSPTTETRETRETATSSSTREIKELENRTEDSSPLSFERAGPREKLFFDPAQTTAAIVTCGGLSPGLNNVIRSSYLELTRNYGVKKVLGIRNGFLGLNPQSELPPIEIDRNFIDSIDKLGGTVLGSSRGPQDPKVMVDFLIAQNIQILFCIGGDGTLRGAHALYEEIQRRNLAISIVGIPKTIDNDIPFVRLSFGYATALEKAAEVISCAHVEARGAQNCIGLVKLMGRYTGMIAAGATIVAQEVNFTLVPEVSFPLEGENGLLPILEERIKTRGHAVIVVAEGAGQDLFSHEESEEKDASGNIKSKDIGLFLKDKITEHFKNRKIPLSIKYFDPSYLIRSVPADSYDRMLCDQMARNAVHAAMAGKTGLIIGLEHEHFIHVPILTLTAQKKQLDLTDELWRAVLQVTGQPRW